MLAVTPLDQLTASPWWAQLLMVTVGAARLVKLLYADRLTDAPRMWLWEHRPPDKSYLGYLFTCPWCLGVWVSTALTTGWFLAPAPTLVIACTSTVAGVSAWLADLVDDED
jgi:hypothetical protein